MIGKRFVRRKWGWYLVLLDRAHFKVKLLRFKKCGTCSKQFHNHRGELWLLMKGGGVFSRGGVEDDYGHWNVYGGDAVLVPQTSTHMFSAFKNTYVLEIQYGERCLEEDIVRV